MTTIKEDYVSFETAKLLKEKGFNERLLTFYITDEAKKEGCFQLMAFTDDKIDNNHSDHCYLAPTLQMAMKWLREVHSLCVYSIPLVTDSDGSAGCLWGYVISKRLETLHKSECLFEEPEQACGEAIKYCLENLI